MTRRFKTAASFLCVLFSFCVVLSGCSGSRTANKKNNAEPLTYYHITPLSADFKTILQKKTGINVNFVSMSNYGNDTLDLLLSSSSLPDIIEYNWDDYKYSPQWLIDYGYLYELNPLIEEFSPNFKKFLDENPSLSKQIQSTRGKYYSYPHIRSDLSFRSGISGLVIREDWLTDLGLSVPVTVPDFENVLLAFKNKKNAVLPFVDHSAFDSILSAFGIKHGFYLDDSGKVCYGPGEPAFKDALILLKRWHNMGLINSDGRMNKNIISQYLISGKSGMAYGYAGSLLDTVNEALKKENSLFRFRAIPNPVLFSGNKPISFDAEKPFVSSAAITTSCEQPEIAAQFLDFGYSYDGQLFYNFGTEDGSPSLENPDGNFDLYEYIRSYSTGPFLQLPEYYEQYLHNDILKEASKIWKYGLKNDKVLPVLQLTNEEHEEAVFIEREITSYVNDMFFRFIIGAQDTGYFENYIDTLNKMKLDRLLEIYQAAYERYLNILD